MAMLMAQARYMAPSWCTVACRDILLLDRKLCCAQKMEAGMPVFQNVLKVLLIHGVNVIKRQRQVYSKYATARHILFEYYVFLKQNF